MVNTGTTPSIHTPVQSGILASCVIKNRQQRIHHRPAKHVTRHPTSKTTAKRNAETTFRGLRNVSSHNLQSQTVPFSLFLILAMTQVWHFDVRKKN